MPKFDFDVTITITHTQTIEAASLEEAKKIVNRLRGEHYFISDMCEELTSDYDSFDSDHLRVGEPTECEFPDFTDETIGLYNYIRD